MKVSSQIEQLIKLTTENNRKLDKLIELQSAPKNQRTFSAIEACLELGIATGSKVCAQRYVRNAYNDGQLPNSVMVCNKWRIDKADVIVLRKKIKEGDYTPRTRTNA